VSATNRGDTGETGTEFYPTPEDAILPILETSLLQLPGGQWIEPCAGTGNLIKVVNRSRSDVRWLACEIDERLGAALAAALRPNLDELLPYGDFVTRQWPWSSRAAVLMMNPPFSLSSQFLEAAFARADHVLMLQRSNWFGSKARAPWLRRHCPDQFTLPTRPSFRPDGGNDNCEYSWFYWPPGDRIRRSGRLAMLDAPRSGQTSLFA
jgi:hypothetical protein